MRIGVLGTGMVGQAIATRLTQLGHDVRMGSRTANNEKAGNWVKQAGSHASQGTFADAAAFGDVLFNCTSGDASLAALKAAGEKNLNGKVLIDVANPASEVVAQRAGYTREGVLRWTYLKPGQRSDTIVYSRLRREHAA